VHLILFAGPVMLKSGHRSIDWKGLDVKTAVVQVSGSSNATALANSLRGADGRILPNVLRKYAPGISPDSVTLASYSAGWGLWNQVTDNDADRADVSALLLNDSDFLSGDPKTGACQGTHAGFVKFGKDAVAGNKLMVMTSAHTTPGSHLTGRQSVLCDLAAVEAATGAKLVRTPEPSAALKASGGWNRMGSSLYWGDFTAPGSAPNQGNDYSHEAQHDLSIPVWRDMLVPWLAGDRGQAMPWWVLPAAGLGAAYLLYRRKR
jgi:hypothetical protein